MLPRSTRSCNIAILQRRLREISADWSNDELHGVGVVRCDLTHVVHVRCAMCVRVRAGTWASLLCSVVSRSYDDDGSEGGGLGTADAFAFVPGQQPAVRSNPTLHPSAPLWVLVCL